MSWPDQPMKHQQEAYQLHCRCFNTLPVSTAQALSVPAAKTKLSGKTYAQKHAEANFISCCAEGVGLWTELPRSRCFPTFPQQERLFHDGCCLLRFWQSTKPFEELISADLQATEQLSN